VIAARFMIMDSFGRHVAISVHDHETGCQGGGVIRLR